MNSSFTISPVLRAILIVTGCVGFSSLMFLKGSTTLANWFALAGIIPFLLGLLGDNLILAILETKREITDQTKSPTASALPSVPRKPSPSMSNQPLNKVA